MARRGSEQWHRVAAHADTAGFATTNAVLMTVTAGFEAHAVTGVTYSVTPVTAYVTSTAEKTPQLTEHNGTRPAPCDEPVTKPEGSDHTPPSSWTTHQRLPFNERMSITSLSGHHTTSLLATTQATAATACPCLNIAAQGHERIITLAASSASIHGSIRETLATAHSIDWTGKAADHYRDRLLTIRNSLSTHDDEARSTAQIAHIAHVSTPQGGA